MERSQSSRTVAFAARAVARIRDGVLTLRRSVRLLGYAAIEASALGWWMVSRAVKGRGLLDRRVTDHLLRLNTNNQRAFASEVLGREVPSEPARGAIAPSELVWHATDPAFVAASTAVRAALVLGGAHAIVKSLIPLFNPGYDYWFGYQISWFNSASGPLLLVGGALSWFAAGVLARGTHRAVANRAVNLLGPTPNPTLPAQLNRDSFGAAPGALDLRGPGLHGPEVGLGVSAATTVRPGASVPEKAPGGVARFGAWLQRGAETLRRGALHVAYASTEAASLAWWTLSRMVRGSGSLDRGATDRLVRSSTNRQRALASEVLGRDAWLAPPSGRLTGAELTWQATNPLIVAVSTTAQATLLIGGVTAIVRALLPLNYGYQYWGGYQIGWDSGSAPLLLFAGLTATTLTGKVARATHAFIARRAYRVLIPSQDQVRLENRVSDLTASRRSALELQEAEIQRIERDLHDGAQARIVTMGMTLTQVERLLEIDPAGARQLLAAAKSDSSAALQDLRGLVRGIRPPVLADRGLVAAVRAIAASSPIDMRVEASDAFRLIAPLESALYFTIAELVTNATKHSGASEIVIDLEDEGDWAVARVTDNGIGGVNEPSEGGLAGIRTRLAPFDGALDVISPVGGPTVATARVPRPA